MATHTFHLSTEATLGLIFGILTTIATLASIRYRDSLCVLAFRICFTSWRRREIPDMERAHNTDRRVRFTLELQRSHSTFLNWPSVPSPNSVGDAERMAWADEGDSGTVEEGINAISTTQVVPRIDIG
ncbi:uncharacterized protein BDZ99DRAFT_521125 [Mytilinidion resinicola]|uniref:Uncharacterized protein n=1 Tax=Mytilinidion resinicola TaxID=574789 RepID=A0A6A6YMM7_9PEZI|nr:uncharacterized protein BDZ99DRAFT_521125 [Mytilinidion resinicola]KAF2809809.1 hypothetical protein BDZ99DRAFT_521125 [Mytilinidion resinicola]